MVDLFTNVNNHLNIVIINCTNDFFIILDN